MVSGVPLSRMFKTIQENDDMCPLPRHMQKEGPPGRMQHGPRLQQHAEALRPAFWAHRGRIDREEEIEIHLLLLGQFGHGELKELEEEFEKIRKRKRAQEEDMEFQQELSQRLAKTEAEFTKQWKARNPAVLDDDVASASAQLPADQGSVSAVATRPASPPSAPTRQATRQAATEEEKSKLLLTLVLSTCIHIYIYALGCPPSQ